MGRRQPQTKGQGPADEAGACDMAETGAAARHVGAGVKRRKAHHARQAAEREQVGRAAAALLPETDVRLVPAADVLAIVDEAGPNYRLLRSRESKKARRERHRSGAEEREEEDGEEDGEESCDESVSYYEKNK